MKHSTSDLFDLLFILSSNCFSNGFPIRDLCPKCFDPLGVELIVPHSPVRAVFKLFVLVEMKCFVRGDIGKRVRVFKYLPVRLNVSRWELRKIHHYKWDCDFSRKSIPVFLHKFHSIVPPLGKSDPNSRFGRRKVLGVHDKYRLRRPFAGMKQYPALYEFLC